MNRLAYKKHKENIEIGFFDFNNNPVSTVFIYMKNLSVPTLFLDINNKSFLFLNQFTDFFLTFDHEYIDVSEVLIYFSQYNIFQIIEI